MAKIVKNNIINGVKKNYYRKIILMIVFMVLSVLCAALAFFTFGISLVGTAVFFYFSYKSIRGKSILKSGFMGEQKTTKILKKLPAGYYVMPDVNLTAGHCHSQIDHIVIGDTGVFVIETKNHKGVIKGNDSDVYARQKKTTAAHNKYKSTLYNPTKQVATHANTLKWLLNKNGYSSIDVEPIVFFVNPLAKVKLSSESVPVFNSRKNGALKLRKYILSTRPNKFLSGSECKKIVDLILNASKK